MSWLKRVLRRGRSTDQADTDRHCSFCGRHLREVRKLVGGPGVAICDDCVRLCDQILDDEAHQRDEGGYFPGALLTSVAQLGTRAPYARTRPLLRAAIELGRPRRDVLREVMGSAIARDDLDTAVAALRAIAAADRTAADTIDLGGLLADLGHHDEARVALASVEPADLDGAGAILHRLLDVWVRLERGGLDPTTIATLRGRITDLGPAAAALPEGDTADGVRGRRLAMMTLAALAAGAVDAAEHAARAHLVAHPESPMAHDHLARVLTARGAVAQAREIRTAGLAFVHAESVFAARLTSPTSAPPFR